MSAGGVRKSLIALLLCACTIPSTSSHASPVIAYGGGNFSRLAQAQWIVKNGMVRTHWLLTAIDMTQGGSGFDPHSARSAAFYLSGLRCKKEACATTTNLYWELDENSFRFDPLMDTVTISLPGKAEVVFRATANPHVATGRQIQPFVGDDPNDFLGAGADAGGVVAVAREARATGAVRGYNGRINTKNAAIYTWTGAYASAGACALDEGAPCL